MPLTVSAVHQIMNPMELIKKTLQIDRTDLKNSRQQRMFFFSTLLLCVSLCLAQPVSANDLDRLLSTLIVGTWAEGSSPYGIVTFAKDGTYQEKMYETDRQEKLLLSLEGTWTIKDSELQSVLTASNSAKAPVGESFADRIVQVNQTELVLIGVDGQRYSKYRVTDKD